MKDILKKSKEFLDGDTVAMAIGSPEIIPLPQPEIEIRTTTIEIKTKGILADDVIKIIHAFNASEYLKEELPNSNLNTLPIKGNVDIEPPTGVDVLYHNRETGEGVARTRHEVDEDEIAEAISMHEIKEKVRLPRTSYNFRCPNCAQGFITKVYDNRNHMWVFRNVSDETIVSREVKVENIKIQDRYNKDELLDIYDGLDGITGDKVLLLYQEGQDCYCPLCEQSDSLKNWMDAHSSPLDYFEVSNVCDICGDSGSLVMTDTTQYCECEDFCLSRSKGLEVPTINTEKETVTD